MLTIPTVGRWSAEKTRFRGVGRVSRSELSQGASAGSHFGGALGHWGEGRHQTAGARLVLVGTTLLTSLGRFAAAPG
jgi:hypothetical protein